MNIQVIQKVADAYLLDNNSLQEAMYYLKLVLEKDSNNYEALVGMGKVHEKLNELDLSI
jgi:hypothetical protein